MIRRAFFAAASASVLWAGLAGAPVLAQQSITLKVADSYPPGHFFPEQGTKPWMKRVTELTNGQVKFEYYPAEQLGKLFDLPALLKGGVADVVLVASGLLPGDYPLASGLPALAGKATSVIQVTNAYWSLLEKDGPIRSEYTTKGIQPLAFFALPQFEVLTKRKAIKTLEDMKGLKLRSGAGLQAEIIAALGATAVQLTPNDTYSAIERGTVDGAMMPYPSAKSYKLEEVTKNATFGAALGTTIVGYAMTEQKWNALPANVREAFRTANLEFMKRLSDYQDEATLTIKKEYAQKGVAVADIGAAENARWSAATEIVTERWLGSMSAKGVPAKVAYDNWLKALAASGK